MHFGYISLRINQKGIPVSVTAGGIPEFGFAFQFIGGYDAI